MALLGLNLLTLFLALLIVALVMWVKTKSSKKDKKRTLGVVVLGLLALSVLTLPSVGIIPNQALASAVAGSDTLSIAGGPQLPVKTMQGSVLEARSNSFTAVNGQVRFYPEGVNPSDPDANPIETISVASGVINEAVSGLKTNTRYRVAYYDNSSTQTWYAIDFGTMVLPDSGYEPQQGLYDLSELFTKVGGVDRIATIADALDETTAANINGATNTSFASGEIEIGCATDCSADSALIYNETSGDGEFYIDFTWSVTGGNRIIHDYSICFEPESTSTGPEGTEYSAIVASKQSGSGFDLGRSDLVNVWKNEDCVVVGDVLGGSTQKDRLTFTVAEANLDTGDDWFLQVEDQGGVNAKDFINLKGSAGDTSADFDSY